MESTNKEIRTDIGGCLADIVSSALEARLLEDRGSQEGALREPRPYVYASAFDKCTRRMFHDVADHFQRKPFDVDTLARFARGDDREDAIYNWLQRAGKMSDPLFKAERGQQEVALRDANGRILVKGKVDGVLVFHDNADRHQRTQVGFDIKSWAQYITARLETFEDVIRSPYAWVAKAAYQVAAYVWGMEIEHGWLIVDRMDGPPLILTTTLEESTEYAEEFWKKAEVVMDAVDESKDVRKAGSASALQYFEKNWLAPLMIDDTRHCRYCWCNGVTCFPKDGTPESSAIEVDEHRIQTVVELEETRSAVSAHYAAKRKVDKWFEGLDLVVCGDYVGRLEEGTKRTTCNVPKDCPEGGDAALHRAARKAYSKTSEPKSLKWTKVDRGPGKEHKPPDLAKQLEESIEAGNGLASFLRGLHR